MISDASDLFIERFPRYALDLSAWPKGQDELLPADAEWLASLPLKHAEVLYLYGLGDGSAALLLQDWIRKHPAHRLIVLEPKKERIVQFLSLPSAKEVLQSTRIEIYHLPLRSAKTALLQELSERYPVRGAFCAAGPHLSSKDRRSMTRTKWQILGKTALTHAAFVDRLMIHIPLLHLLKNASRMPGAFYVNRMKDAFRNIPAIICGAGPSLQLAIEDLGQMENRALIFAGGSAIAALTAQGINPHFAIAIDPNPDEMHRLKNSFAFEVPFLFSSRLFPDCLAAVNGPFGYLRSGMAGIPELWLDEQLGLREPMFGERLSSESLSVTTLSAAIAYQLGCNPILFDGIDLAYSQNRRYADGVAAAEEKGDENLQPVDRHLMKKDRKGKPVMSAVRFVMEARALSKLARRYRDRRWINCTQGGIGVPGVETAALSGMLGSFSKMRDLRALVHSAIERFPMPASKEQILEKIEELRQSLGRVLNHLEILAKGKNGGKCALAEIELQEELAFAILFYDIGGTLRALNPEGPHPDWKSFQQMAGKCMKALEKITC